MCSHFGQRPFPSPLLQIKHQNGTGFLCKNSSKKGRKHFFLANCNNVWGFHLSLQRRKVTSQALHIPVQRLAGAEKFCPPKSVKKAILKNCQKFKKMVQSAGRTNSTSAGVWLEPPCGPQTSPNSPPARLVWTSPEVPRFRAKIPEKN